MCPFKWIFAKMYSAIAVHKERGEKPEDIQLSVVSKELGGKKHHTRSVL